MNSPNFSIIVPIYNEEDAVSLTLNRLVRVLERLDNGELVLVNDGSTDTSSAILKKWMDKYPDIRLVEHAHNQGYGAALKTGIKASKNGLIVIIDADGSYPIEAIPKHLNISTSYDMVIGSRNGKYVAYPILKRIPKFLLKSWLMCITMHYVPDFNSGMRIFKKKLAQECWSMLPNGFSFTTTITMYALCKKRKVRFVPISYYDRLGKSKIHPIKDTFRFFRLITILGLKFVPIRIVTTVATVLILSVMAWQFLF
ncbi:MAG: glycosyltransferase family 2 protein [Bacteroidota bacterium]